MVGAADTTPALPSSPPTDEDPRSYIRRLEKRVSDLEALVRTLLDERKAAVGTPAQAPGVTAPTPPPSPIAPRAAAPPPAEKDEWEEPALPKDTAAGRDEEARRRLTELETWKRKADAKAAKEAEEAAQRVRFDFSGKYKLRFNTRDNLNLDNASQFWQFDNSAYVDQRFQLRIDAEYTPLTAVLVLDKGNFNFDWKEDSEGTLDRWSEFQTVTSALVRDLYVQYTGSIVLKAGRHSLLVGNGGIVLEGPVDAVKLTYPIGETPFGRTAASLAYIAVAGGFRDYIDFRKTGPPAGDRKAVLGLQNKLHAGLFSLDIRPRPDLIIEPYVLKVFDVGRFGDPDLNLDKDFDLNTTPRDGGFEPLWVGAAVSGKSGNFSYRGDFISLTGPFTQQRDLNAYAILLRGDYRFDHVGSLRNLSLGLEFGLGSGNGAEEKVSGRGDVKDFIGLFLCKERRKFGNIFSEDLRAGFFLADSNLSNVTFLRGILELEPIRSFKVQAAVARLWTTEGVYRGRGPVGDWSRGASLSTQKTRDIGWEFDLNLDFPIYRRLRGFAEFGYFLPGRVYQQATGRLADPASEIVLGAELEF
jgi:hypothetical protein